MKEIKNLNNELSFGLNYATIYCRIQSIYETILSYRFLKEESIENI